MYFMSTKDCAVHVCLTAKNDRLFNNMKIGESVNPDDCNGAKKLNMGFHARIL